MSEEMQPPAAAEPPAPVEEQAPAAEEQAAAAADQPAPAEESAAAAEAQAPQLRAPRPGAARRRARWASAAVAAFVIVGLMSYMGYRTFTTRLDSARKVDAATVLIEDADVVVVQVDTVVRSEVTSTLAEPARAAQSQVPSATAQLEQAVELLEAGRDGNTLGDQRRGEGLLAAAKARLQMMEQAPTILRLNIGASEALVPARQGWDGVVAADGKIG